MSNPFLSIIIPAYNEETRLPSTLREIYSFVSQQDYTWEVLVVENGSQDSTLQIAQEFAQQAPNIRVFQESMRGKGLAVRRGMREAQGSFRFMCDADLSMPVSQISRFLPPLASEFDVAIASREAPGSVRFNEPVYRHIGGRLINAMIRLLALPGLHDTQCGFKCFRAEVVDDLFDHQTLAGWSFDIEILYIARRRKYKIVEIPIDWYFNPQSKLRVIQDALQMFMDMLKIRANARQGLYDP